MAFRGFCDGTHRRDFLKAGSLGLLGLSLPAYLRYAAAAAAAGRTVDKSAILIYLPGGQTHMDTWDLKPDAPEEYRGEFKPIKTNVPGIEICEHLPRLAQNADKFAIVRSVSHNLAAHAPGQMFLRTGNRPLPSLQFPGYGSVVTKEYAAPPGLPPYVSLPISSTNGGAETAGYLGVAYNPFTVTDDPNKPDFSVRALALPQGLSLERISSRKSLLEGLDTAFRTVEVKSQDLAGMDRFYQQAFEILNSPKARNAFDISQEPDAVRERYGRHSFGQACLLARRLIEAGVRFVSIDYGSWDTHRNNFEILKTDKLPKLDQGVASLLEDLSARGLLERTAILMTGEFGRTPKVNRNAGRDHWARAMSIVLAGAGIKGGQVIGKTNDKGEEPADNPQTPENVAASFYQALDIDPHKEYYTPTGRPIQIVRDGTPIKELFA
ncbi:MAG: DUF1501 domain-containing protein [Gemmataceae bacterium]|nr:DUF1501 domain-containing protein [Gemmataceae bacterium]MDW8265865.1 DUF1501 domain-containing protein [Gemmataceae bacterium]